MKRMWVIGGMGVVLAAVGLALLLQFRRSAPSSAPREDTTVRAIPTNPEPVGLATKRLVASSIPGVASEFTWSAEVPAHWEAEAVAEIEAINVYDPAAEGSSNLEKSQLFVRHFEANDFLTLSTVTIHSRTELTIASHPAVRYEIEKKAGITDFANQPSWRNTRHIVTDIRVSDANPSVFYVIAARPDLDQAVVDHFLETLQVDDSFTRGESVPTPRVMQPIAEFKERITKKPFGIQITPQNSPVQPERFSGYHTGVDVEYGDPTSPVDSDGASVNTDVPVVAVVDATVVQASSVSGYGGLLVLKSTNPVPGTGLDRLVYLLYGHVRVASLPSVGTAVKRGDQVGVLGTPGAETDGERKHLHFAIYTGEPVSLRGYVESESDLAVWQNPVDVIK